MTDPELHQLVKEHQEDGFRALFEQYYAYVYKIVWGRIRTYGTAEDAEDLVSEIFLQVFLHFDEIREQSLRAYIGTVAKHRAIDHARRAGTAAPLVPADDVTEQIPSGEDIAKSVEDSLENERLLSAIRSLGEPDSTILIGRYFYDLKSNEIAKRLRMTPGAVRVRLNRSLKKLKTLLTHPK